MSREKDQLVRELQDRSQDVGGHPIDLATVKQGARKLQRRRNLVSGAVAAMVAAVAIPSGLVVSNSLTTAQGPDGDSQVAAGPGEPVLLTLDGLERGDDPRIDYLAGRDLVGADGGVTELDAAYRAITPYGAGWLARDFDGNQVFLDAEGRVERTQPGSEFVVNASGSEVAYVTAAEGVQDGPMLVLAPTMGSESLKRRVPVEEAANPIGYVGEGRVVYRIERQSPETLVTSPDGTTERVPGVQVAWGASEHGLIAGMTESWEDGSCSAVTEVDGLEGLWRTCDYLLHQFSPDGRYVLGTAADGDGLGSRGAAILDARTGDVVASFEAGRDSQITMTQLAWESQDTVLAVANEGMRWTIIRLSADGHVTEATEPVESDPYGADWPLWLSTQP